MTLEGIVLNWEGKLVEFSGPGRRCNHNGMQTLFSIGNTCLVCSPHLHSTNEHVHSEQMLTMEELVDFMLESK